MNKNSPVYSDNIDLIDLFKIVWNGKRKIILITLISFLIGFGYDYQVPNNYTNSLKLNNTHNSEFLQLKIITQFINSNPLNELDQPRLDQPSQSNFLFLERFIYELKDYEEFKTSLKNTKRIKENISNLSIEDQEKEILKYLGLLKIIESKDGQDFTVKLTWHDPEEAKKILQNTLNFTLNNLKKKVFNDLRKSLEFKNKIVLADNMAKIVFLKEQSSIAKELNYAENQLEKIILNQTDVSININKSDDAHYYLRGYKAIDNEINIIKNRDYQNFKILAQELNALEIENFKWIDYNIDLISVGSIKKTKLILIISILLGFVIGIFYVLIIHDHKLKN